MSYISETIKTTLDSIKFYSINFLIFLLIISFGIILGKLVSSGLKKIVRKINLKEKVRSSFVDLFIVVIRWSIYLLFISWGINELKITKVSELFSTIILTIPSLTAAIIILIVGCAVAVYLEGIIEESKVKKWEIISKIFFYFIIYVFGVYSIKTALLPINPEIINWIILVLTGIIPISLAIILSKKDK